MQFNVDLQQEILITAHNTQRWWFHDLIVVYTSLLTQAAKWNGQEIGEPDSNNKFVQF